MWLMKDPQASVARSPTVKMASGLGSASIIQNEKFEIAKSLRENRPHSLVEHSQRRIVHRHQDEGRHHDALHARAHPAKATMVHSRCPLRSFCGSLSSSRHGRT